MSNKNSLRVTLTIPQQLKVMQMMETMHKRKSMTKLYSAEPFEVRTTGTDDWLIIKLTSFKHAKMVGISINLLRRKRRTPPPLSFLSIFAFFSGVNVVFFVVIIMGIMQKKRVENKIIWKLFYNSSSKLSHIECCIVFCYYGGVCYGYRQGQNLSNFLLGCQAHAHDPPVLTSQALDLLLQDTEDRGAIG